MLERADSKFQLQDSFRELLPSFDFYPLQNQKSRGGLVKWMR